MGVTNTSIKLRALATVTAAGALTGTTVFNVASVTKGITGEYFIVFATPMPSSDYVVAITMMYGAASGALPSVKTAAGMTIQTRFTSPTMYDIAFNFQVFCN